MKISIVVMSMLCLFSLSVDAKFLTLKPFKSDGCSAFPDGTLKQQELWLHCCRAHDFDYWQGGTIVQRVASDKRLQQCVAKVGYPNVAKLMLAGVRVGGMPYLPTPYRWGYGWPFLRLYSELSSEELKLVTVKTSIIF